MGRARRLIARVARIMAPKVPEVSKWVFQYVIVFPRPVD